MWIMPEVKQRLIRAVYTVCHEGQAHAKAGATERVRPFIHKAVPGAGYTYCLLPSKLSTSIGCEFTCCFSNFGAMALFRWLMNGRAVAGFIALGAGR